MWLETRFLALALWALETGFLRGWLAEAMDVARNPVSRFGALGFRNRVSRFGALALETGFLRGWLAEAMDVVRNPVSRFARFALRFGVWLQVRNAWSNEITILL